MSRAKNAKQDEFYTQLGDISNELKHYKTQLRGKTILCNCDDPYESNFFKYFALNFNTLGIKTLIATSYVKSPIVGGQLPLLEIEGLKPEGKEPYAIEIKKVPDQRRRGTTDITDVEYLLKHDANTAWPLRGDGNYNGGDFRSRECIELLKRADIVITNPPFSLFREYMAQLVEHDKTFLIIGSRNAVHYKEIFKLIKENRVWLGHGFAAGNAYFKIPEEVAREFASGVYDPQTGLVKFRNVGWFTNMDYESRHEKIPLYKKYSPAQYPSYDNYGAIEVAKIADIPADYYGAMGVPDTFLDKYNPDQFEIVGIPFGDLGKEIGVTKNHRGRTDIAITKDGNSSCPYSRIIIKRRA
ncbi:MAG TPA: adenine-specific methyltransferase EcoRI family protein [Rhizomicrobium sp.]|nr:adenine-specific methyltransferase EcoRI family protein [Rhizomicrobium sp.]